MGTYLKSLDVIRYTANKKEILVTCIYDLYSNMTIDESKKPVNPVDGNIIMDFSIIENKESDRGNIIRIKKSYIFTLTADWDSYANHLTRVRLENPTTTRDEESMDTKDATPIN